MNDIEKVAVAGLEDVLQMTGDKIDELKKVINNRTKELEEVRKKQQEILDLIEGIKQLSKD